MTIESRALVSDAFARVDQSGMPRTVLPDIRKESGEVFIDMISDMPRSGNREGTGNAPPTRMCKSISYTIRPDDSKESQATFLIVWLLDYSAWCSQYDLLTKQSPAANSPASFVLRCPAERSPIMRTTAPVSRLAWEYQTLEELATSWKMWPMADGLALFGTWSNEENDRLEPIAAQKAVVKDREQERLANRLWMAFAAEPLEDGMSHLAEEIIGEALRSMEDKPVVLDWLRAFSLDAARPSFAASVLRCLGRQTPLGTSSWRADLVRGGLAMDDVEIRDAAVQAAESWGDRSLADVMKAHSESEPWLREYIEDVIGDLGE